jgi:hypothetical protein
MSGGAVAASANGWTANDRSLVSRRLIPRTQVGITVRNGVAGDLLLEVASRFDQEVQDIDNARGALDDWGYAERPIRGGTTLSNHASGTAIDLNATKWPLGSAASVNLSPAQITTTRKIVAACLGVVVWGAGWRRPDPMHFELAVGSTSVDCARALRALKGASTSRPGRPVVQLGDIGDAVELVQRFLAVVDPGDPGYGTFGPRTQQAVIAYQKMRGLQPDGVVGKATWAEIDQGLWPRSGGVS